MQNKTSALVYAVWPFILSALMGGIGLHFHSAGYIWAIGLGLMVLGVANMIYQIKTGGDTNLLPYVIQFIALLVFLLLTYSR